MKNNREERSYKNSNPFLENPSVLLNDGLDCELPEDWI